MPAPSRGRNAHRCPRLELDHLVVELGLCAARDEDVDLLLNGVPMAAGGSVPCGEALEGDCDVAECERFTKKADLEAVGIHTHVRGHVPNIGYAGYAVIGHDLSLQS